MKKNYQTPSVQDVNLLSDSLMAELTVSPGVHNDLVGAPVRSGNRNMYE